MGNVPNHQIIPTGTLDERASLKPSCTIVIKPLPKFVKIYVRLVTFLEDKMNIPVHKAGKYLSNLLHQRKLRPRGRCPVQTAQHKESVCISND